MTSITQTRWGTLEIDMTQIDVVLNKAAVSQRGVVHHVLYDRLTSIENLRVFMEHHVFAVLDFMWLLKRLQRDLTSTDQFWRPVGDPNTRRLINEIVVGEESDEIDGEVTSHFEFYLRAMDAAGADTGPVRRLVEQLDAGMELPDALAMCGASEAASRFILTNSYWITDSPIHETAGAFAFGREKLIPDMFVALRQFARMASDQTELLLTYLDRHIDLDGDEHTPLAFAMVTSLCGNDPAKWDEVTRAAQRSVGAREALWDDVVACLDDVQLGRPVAEAPTMADAEAHVLQHLWIGGTCSRDDIIAATRLGDSIVDKVLEQATFEGLIMRRHNPGCPLCFTLTQRGREAAEAQLSEQLDRLGVRNAVTAIYERFLPLNVRFKECCTSWQIRDRATLALNDHSDPDYDHNVLAELSAIHELNLDLCAQLAAAVPRYSTYAGRFTQAMAAVEAGDFDWFTKPMIDSYHTVWFELHENLLFTLNRQREDEESGG